MIHVDLETTPGRIQTLDFGPSQIWKYFSCCCPQSNATALHTSKRIMKSESIGLQGDLRIHTIFMIRSDIGLVCVIGSDRDPAVGFDLWLSQDPRGTSRKYFQIQI